MIFEVIEFETIDSTQTHLIEKLKNLGVENIKNRNFIVTSIRQTNGLGSRGNSWSEIQNSLYLSFNISLDSLPKDLKIHSASLYFATILKEILSKNSSKLWIKWPNDFYLNDSKIGGVLTNIWQNQLICGIGLNLKNSNSNNEFKSLDIDLSRDKILLLLKENLEYNLKSWNEVFTIYSLDFSKSKKFKVSLNGEKVSLNEAKLLNDGSIFLNGERIYNSR